MQWEVCVRVRVCLDNEKSNSDVKETNSHGSLMGKNYVTIPMGYSWEGIMSFTPWVTHGIELSAFIERKMPQSRYTV